MASESVNYQCPNCMGPVHYVGQSGLLECDYCGSSFTPQQIEEAYAAKQQAADEGAEHAAAEAAAGNRSAFDQMADEAAGASAVLTQETVDAAVDVSNQAASPIEAYLSRASWNDDERAGMRSYVCSSCGAQLTVDATTAIDECPYCGNQAMAPGTFSGGAKPDSVIPFKLDKQAAEAALTNYYKGKRFLPSKFASANRVAHVQGVYVPFWLYNGRAAGSGTFEARNISTWREGKDEVTKTDVYRAWREGNSSFTRIPADGSAKMPDGHMDAIEPFDYEDLVPFSVAYLPGYSAERYDQDADECSDRAEERMKNTLAEQLRQSVTGYDQVNSGNVSSQTHIEEVSQALLPVWMLHTQWNDDDYLFAMNGQTGRLVGDLPVSPLKVVLWFLGIFAAMCLICVGIDMAFLELKDTLSKVIVDVVVPLAVAGGVCWYFYSQMKTAKEQTTAFRYVDGGGVNITGSRDTFVTSFVTRRRVEPDDNNRQ